MEISLSLSRLMMISIDPQLTANFSCSKKHIISRCWAIETWNNAELRVTSDKSIWLESVCSVFNIEISWLPANEQAYRKIMKEMKKKNHFNVRITQKSFQQLYNEII